MTVPAADAMRSWINKHPIVTGLDGSDPLIQQGAFTGLQLRSPADGAYVLVNRVGDPPNSVGAEDNAVPVCRIQASVFGGTPESAELAAGALRNAFEGLSGCPEDCGDRVGTRVLISDNVSGPSLMPPPQEGEIYCYLVTADFVLTAG
jgi:hypothetical protein